MLLVNKVFQHLVIALMVVLAVAAVHLYLRNLTYLLLLLLVVDQGWLTNLLSKPSLENQV